MAIPKGLRKKIEAALKRAEAMKLQNNFFILKPTEKPIDIPEKSLVIQLTGYDDLNG